MTDPKALAAALRDNFSKQDIAASTLDDIIRRAVVRYGAAAVKEAVKRQTKTKRGRKPEKDWPELRAVIEDDARAWLAGGDPFTTRTNYSIAKEFADKNPGHSHPGTMRRILRKLKQSRVLITLVTAEAMGRDGYPFEAYVRTLGALVESSDYEGWKSGLDRTTSTLAEYEAQYGKKPSRDMSMAQIEEKNRNPLIKLSNWAASGPPDGLFNVLKSIAPRSPDPSRDK